MKRKRQTIHCPRCGEEGVWPIAPPETMPDVCFYCVLCDIVFTLSGNEVALTDTLIDTIAAIRGYDGL